MLGIRLSFCDESFDFVHVISDDFESLRTDVVARTAKDAILMDDRSAVVFKRDRLDAAAPYTLVAVLAIIRLAYQASFHTIPP